MELEGGRWWSGRADVMAMFGSWLPENATAPSVRRPSHESLSLACLSFNAPRSRKLVLRALSGGHGCTTVFEQLKKLGRPASTRSITMTAPMTAWESCATVIAQGMHCVQEQRPKRRGDACPARISCRRQKIHSSCRQRCAVSVLR